MILILGYNNSETVYLNDILNDLGYSYRYSLLETQIIRSDRIIMPDPLNLQSTFRRMNIMNLFSLLRLYKKPILGINDATKLMCNNIKNISKCGLGLFDIDINSLGESDEDIVIDSSITISTQSKLLSKKNESIKVKYNKNRQLPLTKYSTITFPANDPTYSIALECDNAFGIELDFANNKLLARKIIDNFCLINID